MQVTERSYSPVQAYHLLKDGFDPVLARVYAARGVRSRQDLTVGLDGLLPFESLTGAVPAAKILFEHIRAQRRILIVSDYDADGATACAIGLRALRAWGANVGYLIPNRLEHGYGLSPEIVRIAAELDPRPELIVTVDNGIASHAGIEEARRLRIPVLVTDHHLPASTLPGAAIIVNPNQGDCGFRSRALAGCGVIWYVLWALEALLREEKWPRVTSGFQVQDLLPLVALGTIADVVPLDRNNRSLVQAGLERLRAGAGYAGLNSLCIVANKDRAALSTTDLGWALGPRINAAGRLESMNAGVECLTTDDPNSALQLAQQLHSINQDRREIEAATVLEAVELVRSTISPRQATVVTGQVGWHKGVIGIVAGRVREQVYRPTFIFAAQSADGEFTGSGRSIPGFHLRDALDLVDKRAPGVLRKFGGHAMAAGATLTPGKLERFQEEFERVGLEMLSPDLLRQTLETDGSLESREICIDTAERIREGVWGQGFPEPLFLDRFRVVTQRRMGQDNAHLRLLLERGGQRFEAVRFRADLGEVPSTLRLAYRLGLNHWQGETRLQLMIEHMQAA